MQSLIEANIGDLIKKLLYCGETTEKEKNAFFWVVFDLFREIPLRIFRFANTEIELEHQFETFLFGFGYKGEKKAFKTWHPCGKEKP